ncbi:replication factor C small subunit [Candidatus Mancarchaeum acidiphilum]|uniref:Replication factor C small subunit n=1 Tax=Candidatus Mancarchaeum acidiphilum TaxID=1920749 RepID=A0A218NM71_9ARCH|nr:replication factor C small subunit [Candidatus Mancarchaeum acidiphilum]ASI13562.1 replication factor C small subunit [Candidatus Mancarchaeum acidiphilum]
MDNLDLPWTEKYRPKSLNDVIGQNEIVKRLRSFVKTGNFPNMIFAGPAGIGKTTCAIAIANDLYKDRIEGAFKELNASDARGIDVIRGEVKEFARTLSLADVPIKIIFLDEADALTTDAQHALRRTMEKFSSETRFILSANYASKIIDPIQSRCVVFRFKPLNEKDMKEYIERIIKGENLDISDSAIEALIYISEGDLRKLTNTLQSAAMRSNKIDESDIYEIAARARPKEIVNMLKFALNGEFEKSTEELDKLMIQYGLSAEDILLQCYKEIPNMNIKEKDKLRLMVDIASYNFRIVEGANERIQLQAMLAHIAMIGIQKSE